MVNKSMFILGHCTGMYMTRATLLEAMKPNADVCKQIEQAMSDNFIALQGETQSTNYQMVLMALKEKHENLEPVAFGPYISIIGF